MNEIIAVGSAVAAARKGIKEKEKKRKRNLDAHIKKKKSITAPALTPTYFNGFVSRCCTAQARFSHL